MRHRFDPPRKVQYKVINAKLTLNHIFLLTDGSKVFSS